MDLDEDDDGGGGGESKSGRAGAAHAAGADDDEDEDGEVNQPARKRARLRLPNERVFRLSAGRERLVLRDQTATAFGVSEQHVAESQPAAAAAGEDAGEDGERKVDAEEADPASDESDEPSQQEEEEPEERPRPATRLQRSRANATRVHPLGCSCKQCMDRLPRALRQVVRAQQMLGGPGRPPPALPKPQALFDEWFLDAPSPDDAFCRACVRLKPAALASTADRLSKADQGLEQLMNCAGQLDFAKWCLMVEEYDERFLRERQSGKPWSWSILRPVLIVGCSEGSAMNVIPG